MNIGKDALPSSALYTSAPLIGAPVGCTSNTRMSCDWSISVWRKESRVRKKLALTRNCPDAAGNPGFGVVKVQEPEMQSVALFASAASGSVGFVPDRHLPGEAGITVPFLSLTGAS